MLNFISIMIKGFGFLLISLAFSLIAPAQTMLKEGRWHAELLRKDGFKIPFDLDIQQQKGKTIFSVLNGKERIKMESPEKAGDSVIIRMPVFESYFKLKVISRDSLSGFWISRAEKRDIAIPLTAGAGSRHFAIKDNVKPASVQGKWSFEFTRANQTKRRAIGEFQQQGHNVSGSVLTPSGDYRYLNGIVSGDSLLLSTFDGSNAMLFKAGIHSAGMNGIFYSGATTKEPWTAVKNDNAALEEAMTGLKENSDGKLDFTFNDLDGNPVSIQSDRYKGKVVILQLMGSWCPNCMDETSFLSDYYKKNKDRGVEVIALAYELSTDESRSVNSLKKFQKQFNVRYPMLNTGAAVSDPQRTEKTLPQLTPIKVFPTTVILDKAGVVRDIDTGFYGPGSGEYYLKFKSRFEAAVNKLLAE